MAPESDERGRFGGALIELCFERGYRAVGRAELLERADLDLVVFERHFASLEDCFLETLEAEVDRFRREVAARAGGSDWRRRIRAGVYASYRLLAADRRLARFLLVESRAAGERSALFVDRLLEGFVEQVDAGRRELADPDSIGPTTAEALVGGIFNRLYGIVGRGASLPPEATIVPELMYVIVLPYLGAAAAREELAIAPPLASRARPVAANRG